MKKPSMVILTALLLMTLTVSSAFADEYDYDDRPIEITSFGLVFDGDTTEVSYAVEIENLCAKYIEPELTVKSDAVLKGMAITSALLGEAGSGKSKKRLDVPIISPSENSGGKDILDCTVVIDINRKPVTATFSQEIERTYSGVYEDYIGMKFSLSEQLMIPEGCDWRSSDSTVAVVNGDKAAIVAEGEATLTGILGDSELYTVTVRGKARADEAGQTNLPDEIPSELLPNESKAIEENDGDKAPLSISPALWLLPIAFFGALIFIIIIKTIEVNRILRIEGLSDDEKSKMISHTMDETIDPINNRK